jgi:hypothetical protein
MWLKHPDIAKAWAHGRSSKTGKKEGKTKNTGLPARVKRSIKRKGFTKNYR